MVSLWFVRKGGMGLLWIAISLVGVVLGAAEDSWNSTDLCLTGSAPFKLADQCDLGWYCPLYVAGDNSTYPVQCAATNDCIVDRLQTKFCSRQGKYEPQLCEKGYYCPTPLEKIKCPKDHICPLGQYKPIPCGAMTTCDEGASKKFEWSSMIAILVTDIGAILLYFLLKQVKKQYRILRDNSYNPKVGYVELSAVPVSVSSVVPSDDEDDDRVKKLEYLEAGLEVVGDEQAAVRSSKKSERHLHAMVVCEGFKKAREALPSMLVEFKNLSLTIPSKHKGVDDIHLLKGVTCSFVPGTVNAIMGPSGAGKTMTLSTMLGNTNANWIRGGELKVNGIDEDLSRFKKIVGYVPQDDIMHRELTVYENILYSANIRLPNVWTAAEKKRHVNAVIHALHLAHVQDIRVGDEVHRGISGGQRKRCNVGMELAAAPSLLLLDEPTSGLDSTASMELCQLLKEIAENSQLTVAMVIHQPRVEIWNALDQLLLLAPGGLTVYQGPQTLAVDYFREYANVSIKAHDNPADALMDNIAKHGQDFTKIWAEKGRLSLKEVTHADAASPGVELISAKDISDVKDQELLGSEVVEVNSAAYPPFSRGTLRHTASFYVQIYLSFVRNLSQQLATYSSLGLEVGLALLAGGLMGSMVEVMYQGILQPPYTLLSSTPLEGLIAGFFFSVGLSISLAAASAGVSVFGEELVIYRKEVASGHSHAAYYIGVTLAQFPRIFLDSIHFAWIFHIQNQTLTPFRIFFVITFLLYTAIYGLAAIVSMIVSRQNAALLAVVASLFFSSMTRKGGFPEGLQYLSASRWAVEAMFNFETEPFRHVMQVEAVSADIGGYTLNRVPSDILFMFLVGLLYRLLAYIAMRYADQSILK